ncbi:aldose 1-epimerase [Mucilaginibacter yixingensis]|uniref:Aldose 1-epimerase n=1 Tax=Mucilaginibacter yixingensis TaxID=1295612 RepID=A0A2T5J509_9SPHI|nr:aldose epimerase family protein [Mucilaginibacter yixingensis]PTQ92916.1 aldose 1-epimerase [Mucilaginibacter yixingensis]
MNISVKNFSAAVMLAAAGLTACNQPAKTSSTSTDDSTKTAVTYAIPAEANFQDKIDGKTTDLYTLKNKNGVTAAITSFGGRLVSLLVPDKAGKMTDVVIGFDSVKPYTVAGDFYGATIGRYGNRIGGAKFTLEGKVYNLSANDHGNTLHGGTNGFDMKVWDAKKLGDNQLEIDYVSKDGENGFPGNLSVKVTYALTDDNALKISYEATTDKPTVCNLTNHAYWNLNGVSSGTILNHTLQIDADNITPVDSTLIPTGKMLPVAGTPFDFKAEHVIGERIGQDNDQLKKGKGYDHNWVLNKHDLNTPITTLTGDKTGIVMQVYTEEPGIQFYSGNFMAGKYTIKGGGKNDYRNGLCLETQHFPDSPNKPAFPTTELKPGQTYKTVSIYKFSVKK